MAQYYTEEPKILKLKTILKTYESLLSKSDFIQWFFNPNYKTLSILEQSIFTEINFKEYIPLLDLIYIYAKKDEKVLFQQLYNKTYNVFHLCAIKNKIIPFIFYYEKFNALKPNNINILNIPNKINMIPLHCACIYNNKIFVDFFLNLKCDINYLNKDKKTALHITADTGNIVITKKLILYGANKYIKDNKNNTPIEIAKSNNYSILTETLNNNNSIINNEHYIHLTILLLISLIAKTIYYYYYTPIYIEYIYKRINYISLYISFVLDILLLSIIFFFNIFGYSYYMSKTRTTSYKCTLIELVKKAIDNSKKENDLNAVLDSICPICHIFKKSKTKHCAICDKCVDEWDHHCFWLGRCICKSNKKYFYLFLINIFISVIFDVTLIMGIILSNNCDNNFRILLIFLLWPLVMAFISVIITIKRIIEDYNFIDFNNDNEPKKVELLS